MLDFIDVVVDSESRSKKLILYPEFIIKKSKDLMIRGHDFYAIWDDETGLWSKDEYRVQELVDKIIFEKKEAMANPNVKMKLM